MSSLINENVNSTIAELIAGRKTGIRCKADIGEYTKADIMSLEDPTIMPNMEKCADAVSYGSKGGKAIIFGDYDADGVVSSYMMRRLLLGAGYTQIDIFIPDRINEGYGLNDTAVTNFLAKHTSSYDLIVALDCGSSSRSQIEMMKKQHPNAKIIILDHHIISDDSYSENADAVLNPRLGTGTQFCTGGVVYQFARVIGERMGISPVALLPYAAITTVADVCDLRQGNRLLVCNGLDAIAECPDPGLKMIMEKAGIDPERCTVRDIGFGIGPMINAAGRLKHANGALSALLSPNIDTGKQMAAMLAQINEDRKALQNKIFDEALLEFGGRKGMSSALIYNAKWHTGVVGIVASKICEKFGVPTLCFGGANGKIKGSARSLEGIHVKNIMDDCSHLFSRHGGHEMAAGATMNNDKLEEAWDTFDTAVKAYLEEHNISLGHKIRYDADIDEAVVRRIDGDFCGRLDSLGPFGHGNERPVLCAKGLQCKSVFPWGSGKGAFFKFDKLSLDCYGRTGDADPKLMKHRYVDILFEIERSFTDKDKWAANIQHVNMSQSVS